jgi:hypothetical protein
LLKVHAEGIGNSPSNPKVADIVRIINKQNIKLVCLVETWWDGARDSVVPVGWQGAVGSTYRTSQGKVRRGIAVWWKTGLDVAPLPDNCFNFLYGFKIRGSGKGNDLVGAVLLETLSMLKACSLASIAHTCTFRFLVSGTLLVLRF